MKRNIVKTVTVPVKDNFDLILPAGAEILALSVLNPHRAGQSETLELLVMTDEEQKDGQKHLFRLCMANVGFAVPDDEALRFVGHAMVKKGSKAYVLFERVVQPAKQA